MALQDQEMRLYSSKPDTSMAYNEIRLILTHNRLSSVVEKGVKRGEISIDTCINFDFEITKLPKMIFFSALTYKRIHHFHYENMTLKITH